MSERISAGATVFTVFAVFNRCFRERRGEHTETPNFSLRELAGKRSKTVGKRSQNGAKTAAPSTNSEFRSQSALGDFEQRLGIIIMPATLHPLAPIPY